MPLSQQVGDEKYRALLERFFSIVSGAVHRFEGTVNQYLGDGMMALFGAPLAHEDHAQRACYAALRARDQLRALSEELRQQGIPFTARIGLNSGDVIVGKIGPDLRMDYTAQGHTANLAKRMEELAEPGQVYLAPDTARRVEGYFDLEDLGPRQVKGVATHVRVFALKAVGRLRTRLERAQVRGLSPLVGRARELRVLDEALEQTLAGNGQIVGVVGDAGVGKSRLCLEFVGRCQKRGLRVDEAHCPSHGKTDPYGAVLQLLRSMFGLRPDERGAPARSHLASQLRELEPSFEDSLPLIADFFGMTDPGQPAPEPEGEAREHRLLRFVAQLVQARSRVEPSVLLLDDAHWIDEASDAFLAAIALAVSGTRTLLLVNFRPEYQAKWMSGSDYQQLPLRPLGSEDADTLLIELLGDVPETAPLRDRIVQQTCGTPFFIEEVVQSLAESESLSGTRGAYRLATGLEELAVPATVQDVLAARIDRLPDRDKRVLQMAAVIGREIPEGLLARVAELPETELDDALTQVRQMEFLHETALFPDVVYEFKHPFTKDAAYDSQLQDRRARTHAAVAAALVELHGEQAGEQGMLIGHHLAQAGQRIEAARWYMKAFGPLIRRSYREGSRCCQEMLTILGDLTALPPAERQDAAELIVQGSMILLHYGNFVGGTSRGEADRLLQRAQQAASLEHIPIDLMMILQISYLESHAIPAEESIERARQVCELAEQTRDEGLRLFAEFTLHGRMFRSRRYSEAYEVLQRQVESPPSDPLIEVPRADGYYPYYARFLGHGAQTAALLGKAHEAVSLLEGSIRLLRRDGRTTAPEETQLRGDESSYRCTPALIREYVQNAAFCYSILGDAERGLKCARAVLEFVQGTDSPSLQALGNGLLGAALRFQRDWQSLAKAADAMGALDPAQSRGWRAEARAHLGEQARVVEEVERLLADMSMRRHPAALVSCAHTLRYCDAARSRHAVEPVFARLKEAIEESGARAYTPFLPELRAQLPRVCGDKGACERERAEAERLWTAMGAEGHIERMALELEELRP